MNKVQNLSRQEAINFSGDASNSIWLSIGEPIESFAHISNPILNKIPKLHLSFWDITKLLPGVLGEDFYPPNLQDAEKIVNFILQNPNKDVIVNCKMGKSRSAAVAQFCHESLKYEWGYGQQRAIPNTLLVKLLKECYAKI